METAQTGDRPCRSIPLAQLLLDAITEVLDSLADLPATFAEPGSNIASRFVNLAFGPQPVMTLRTRHGIQMTALARQG